MACLSSPVTRKWLYTIVENALIKGKIISQKFPQRTNSRFVLVGIFSLSVECGLPLSFDQALMQSSYYQDLKVYVVPLVFCPSWKSSRTGWVRCSLLGAVRNRQYSSRGHVQREDFQAVAAVRGVQNRGVVRGREGGQ